MTLSRIAWALYTLLFLGSVIAWATRANGEVIGGIVAVAMLFALIGEATKHRHEMRLLREENMHLRAEVEGLNYALSKVILARVGSVRNCNGKRSEPS